MKNLLLVIIALVLVFKFSYIFEEKSTAIKLMSLQSKYSKAIKETIKVYGTIDTWGIGNASEFFGIVESNLNVKRVCEENDYSLECFQKSYSKLNGKGDIDMSQRKFYKFVLNDGSSGAFYFNFPKCDVDDSKDNLPPLNALCGSIWVDINGLKEPNVYGIDLFQFLMTKDGTIVPRGSEQDKVYSIEKHCSNTTQSGDACGAWILEFGNMNYLRNN